MKIIATRKQDQNEALVDPWSAVHATSGLAFGLTGIGILGSVAAAVMYDILEQLFERSRFGQKFFQTSGPESWGNVITDLVLFTGGWYLGNRWNTSGPAVHPNPGARRRRRRRANPGGHPPIVIAPRGQRQRAGVSHVSQRNAIDGTIEGP